MHGSLILRCRMRSAICIHWDRREEGKRYHMLYAAEHLWMIFDRIRIHKRRTAGSESIGQVDDKESALANKRNDRNCQAVAD